MPKGILTVLLLTATLAGCSKEPTYQGKSESDWIALTSDRDADTARRAWEAVASFPDAKASERMREGLSDRDPVVRAIAAGRFTATEPGLAVDALRSALKEDPGRMVREPHFRTATALLGPKAAPVRADLQTMLDKDPQGWMAEHIREAISSIPGGATQPTTR
jgi:HEAT repeat protein